MAFFVVACISEADTQPHLDAARGIDLSALDPPVTIVTKAGEGRTAHSLRAGAGASRSRLELAAERDAAADRRDEITVVADSLREALADAARTLDAARQRTKSALSRRRPPG